MSKLKVGIVGCGEVAQIIHIPALQQLRDRYEITALCDISRKVLEGVAAQCGNDPALHDRSADLVTDPNVDVVLVANPHVYHAEVAIAALEAGKNVFIEKPMCVTLGEADALAEADARSPGIVHVGYMRRYAPAFLEAKERVAELGDTIRVARVQDIIGRNPQIIEDTSVVVRDPDVSAAAREDMTMRENASFKEAIGIDEGDLKFTYRLLLGLSSHDISAMRELLGRPKRVLHATARGEGRVITAVFDYGSYVCEFTTAIDGLARFDAFLQVNAAEAVVRIDYETPYVRNLPARLTVTRPNTTHGVSETVSFPSRKDTFVIEWTLFHEAVTKGRKPKTTIADAREDLEIFLEIIEHLKAVA